ncbi:hypothetical protein [Actinomadura chokoriensis]|uniref:Uncharacterized protein n=1 Tax=Actinomadura chokoriensis TaxID=454156 RepID=A0ABV4QUX4_9ACTN
MAGDAARVWTVSVLLRRVAANRAVQRLLFLGGLLIAGWLLACAAQSAHADEFPAPAEVVTDTPVLGQTVETVHEREPVRLVVRAVAQKAPRTMAQKASTPVRDVSDISDVRVIRRPYAAPRAVPHPAPQARKRLQTGAVPSVSKSARTRSSVGHGTRHAVQHPPMPAPERHGDHSAAGGLVAGGAAAGFSNSVARAPAPPRAPVARVSGALPPAVRTAADEPSFAPD